MTEHKATPEEEAYRWLLNEEWKTLSEAARIVVSVAQSAAYAGNLVRSYCFEPEEYDEARDKMRLAAAGLTNQDCELLMQLVRRAIVASASIDVFDEDTLVGYGVYCSDLHRYYRMVSDMVRDTLYEEFNRRWIAEQKPVEDCDIPF